MISGACILHNDAAGLQILPQSRTARAGPPPAAHAGGFGLGAQVSYKEKRAMKPLRVKKVPGRREGDDVLRDIDILQRTVNELRSCGLVPAIGRPLRGRRCGGHRSWWRVLRPRLLRLLLGRRVWVGGCLCPRGWGL